MVEFSYYHLLKPPPPKCPPASHITAIEHSTSTANTTLLVNFCKRKITGYYFIPIIFLRVVAALRCSGRSNKSWQTSLDHTFSIRRLTIVSQSLIQKSICVLVKGRIKIVSRNFIIRHAASTSKGSCSLEIWSLYNFNKWSVNLKEAQVQKLDLEAQLNFCVLTKHSNWHMNENCIFVKKGWKMFEYILFLL